MGDTPESAAIHLSDLTKSYGPTKVLESVSLEVRQGEFFTLLGPSGSGKTTVLRIIAGLVEPDHGDVTIYGRRVNGLPAYERNVAVVFQSLALFPHLSVGENIAFPLKMRRVSRKERDRLVRNALSLVKLPDIIDRHVTELSGGQRQRVALARALVYEPRILLLDEPLSALDRRLREAMQVELMRIHRDLGVTMINVTHDQREALLMSDRIAVMDRGQVVQCGQPDDLYRSPETAFVAGFLGDPLMVEGTVESTPQGQHFRSTEFQFPVEDSTPTGPAVAALRPERLKIVDRGSPPSPGTVLDGTVRFAAFEGTGNYYRVALDCGLEVAVHEPARSAPGSLRRVGALVSISWTPGDVPVVPVGS